MRKNILALSMAAGLAFAGSAHAVTNIAVATAAASADALAFSETGIGNILLVPYFSTQAGNATLLSIVNTDATNAKAVKVRFRGASNSDDIFDFQVFLSPNDVWTANISRGADGRSQLTTSDASCTKPADVNRSFITARLNPALDADALANQTREGYIEILNMADITPGDLFDAVLHTDGVAPCEGAAWTGLDTDLPHATLVGGIYAMANGSGGLMANWTIVNLDTAAAYGASATAIAGGGSVVYYPQTANLPSEAMTLTTADPLLQADLIDGAQYDLPDLSTPYVVGATPESQALALSAAMATAEVVNEYLTDAAVQASTDWVFSMPTRRYAVAVDYSADPLVIVDNAGVADYFAPGVGGNVSLVGDQICVTGIDVTSYDREEGSPADPSDVVISPGTPAAPRTFCGETSVFAVNGTGTSSALLGASVALNNVDATYDAGWMRVATPGATGNGLPVLGGAFVRAISGSSNFGVNWNHKFIRP